MKTESTQEMEKKNSYIYTKALCGILVWSAVWTWNPYIWFSQQWDGCNFEAYTDYILDIELGDSYVFLFPYFLFAFKERMKIYSWLRNVNLFS